MWGTWVNWLVKGDIVPVGRLCFHGNAKSTPMNHHEALFEKTNARVKLRWLFSSVLVCLFWVLEAALFCDHWQPVFGDEPELVLL